MHFLLHPRLRAFTLAGLGLMVLSLAWLTPNSRAQSFIEPSHSPPLGRIGSYLDTSTNDQRKLGSLVVGDDYLTQSDELCLNPPVLNRQLFCVRDWSDLTTRIGGPFVRTNQTLPPITNPPSARPVNCAADPQSYFCRAQSGYVYLRGNDAVLPTYITTAHYTLGTSTALYGHSQGQATSYAAYFNGRVEINRTVDLGGGPGDLGQLCLNATFLYTPGAGPRYGCISNWTDIAAAVVSPYVKLQQFNPPREMQQQAARVSRAFQFGSFVTGGVTLGPDRAFYCGDGLCSTSINENSGNCSLDCGAGGPPPSGCFTAATPVDTPQGPVAIAQLKVGDQVYAYDEATQQRVISTIEKVLSHPPEAYGLLTLADGTSLEVTRVHRFYRPATRTWEPIGTLPSGELLVRMNGGVRQEVAIKSQVYEAGVGPVYNLTVKLFHTYYVDGVLVHNVKEVFN